MMKLYMEINLIIKLLLLIIKLIRISTYSNNKSIKIHKHNICKIVKFKNRLVNLCITIN